jgi:hypothetical protein
MLRIAAAAPTVNKRRSRFVVCIDAGEYAEVDLDVRKVYQALPTEKSARDHGLIRVIDNSGEDYPFSAEQFVEAKLPRAAQQAVLRARAISSASRRASLLLNRAQ